MDELELSGRRHLSAKRAAREHRYHSDYIGQLIRSGKVAGQKVGRSWYVDAESLDAYFKGEAMPMVAPAPAPQAAPAPAPASVVETVVAAPEPVVVAPTPVPLPPQPAPSPAPDVTPIKITKTPEPAYQPPAPPVQPTPAYAPPPTGLRFVPDEEPLLHPVPHKQVLPQEAEDEEVEIIEHAPRRGISPLAMAIAAVFAFAIAAGSSYLMVERIVVVGESSSASVQLSTP